MNLRKVIPSDAFPGAPEEVVRTRIYCQLFIVAVLDNLFDSYKGLSLRCRILKYIHRFQNRSRNTAKLENQGILKINPCK